MVVVVGSWYAFIATLKSAIDKYIPYFATATTTHHRKCYVMIEMRAKPR